MKANQWILAVALVVIVAIAGLFIYNTSTQNDAQGPYAVSLGETVSVFGVAVTPIRVLEDSRCPIDVQCIQAGRIRLEVTLVSAMGTATETFEVGTAITTEDEEVTLVEADPDPVSTEPQAERDYTFYFDIKRR